MTFLRFLYSKGISLCGIGICSVSWGIFASLAGVDPFVIGITFAGGLVAAMLWLFFGYFSAKGRLKKIERLCTESKDGYLLGEVLPRPVNIVEEEYFRIMKTVSRSAVSKTEELLRSQADYCDYVERWIHEVKTPLTACSLILANGGDLRKLKQELKRADNLTELILYYARMRTIEADTQIRRISVKEAVDEAIKSETELLLAAKIGVEIEGDFGTYTDGKALVFILKQLLVNCAKYCPHCSITITAQDGVLSVEDNGPGILSHELPRVFARGFVGSAGQRRGGGTGMGLYLAHELCQRLNIALTVCSEKGKFTRFRFAFPAAETLTNL